MPPSTSAEDSDGRQGWRRQATFTWSRFATSWPGTASTPIPPRSSPTRWISHATMQATLNIKPVTRAE